MLVVLVGLLGAHAYAQAPAQAPAERSWRVMMKLISGTGSFCNYGNVNTVREGNGKFRLMNREGATEVWAIAQAADGSVSGETRSHGANRPLRVTVPAGTSPRAFDVLDLQQVCRMVFEPM